MKKNYLFFIAAIAVLTMTAQTTKEGSIEVGNTSSTYNGSYFDMAPTNFYVAHTGVQMIYTPDLLDDMTGKHDVTISKLQFMFHDETFEEIVRNVKIYLQESDATAFEVIKDVKQFFSFDNLVAESQLDIDMLDSYGEDCTIEFPVNFAFTPGKSLIVTMAFDAVDDDNCTTGSDYAPFYTSGISGKAMTYTNNWSSFVDYAQGEDFPDATAVLGCGTNVALPYTQISYTYVEMNPSGVTEIADGKTVAGVRYFSIDGKEMNQPAGLTIAVTTYNDGTTKTEKIVK